MAKVLVTEGHLNNIAEAIRSKNGASTTYRPGDMAAAIQALDTSGIHPTGTKNITQNGTHDVTQYASANVNVQPNLQSKTATENGTVVPDQGYDGLSDVTVNVEGGAELVGILKYGKTIFLSGTNKLVITASAAYQTFFVLGQKGVMGLITEMNGGNPQTNLSSSSGTTVSATAMSALSVKVSISGSNTSMNVYSAADFSVSSEA